jgi:hypothetical protein
MLLGQLPEPQVEAAIGLLARLIATAAAADVAKVAADE